MAELVKYRFGTEAQILALTPASPNWTDRAFYYPDDKDYFFQVVNGVMKKYGGGTSAGIGVKLDGIVMGGAKTKILSGEVLDIPENYDYNTYKLDIDGVINCSGQINMI